jgi:hypothetical protein
MLTTMKFPRLSTLAAVAFVVLPATASAQVLTAGTPVTGDDSFLTIGTEVWGGTSIGQYSNANYVLSNGVTLNDAFNNSQFVSDPNSTVQVDQDGAAFGDQTGNLSFSDSTLNNALGFNSASGSYLFLNIKGLTPGDVYVVQYIDALTASGNINGAGSFNATESVYHEEGVFTGVEASPTATSTLSYGQTPDPANPGQYLDSGVFSGTDTFTANSNGTAFLLFANSSNGINLLAAAQIRNITDVPEPTTYAMMFAGLAFLGLLVHRKRATI